MIWRGPATLFSARIFRKLFKAFKEDLVHCQNGISNVITSPIIHTLLFSFSPWREVGEAGRHGQQWVAGWKEPHSQWGDGITPRREQGKKGVDVFRKDLLAACWLQCTGCGKAVEGGRRWCGVKAAPGSGEKGELPVNTVGFGSVASEHPAKGFSSWIKPAQCYIPAYPIYLDVHKNTSY